jgi:hypothetical protein
MHAEFASGRVRREGPVRFLRPMAVAQQQWGWRS